MTMGEFEKQFMNLDVQADVMQGAMDTTVSAAVPSDQVDDLIAAVADENNIELEGQVKPVGAAAKGQAATDDLDERLQKLMKQ
jgi:charged multivesicular body protein 1